MVGKYTPIVSINNRGCGIIKEGKGPVTIFFSSGGMVKACWVKVIKSDSSKEKDDFIIFFSNSLFV